MNSHEDCLLSMINRLGEMGCEAVASDLPGHPCDWWEEHTCRLHGLTYYVHPTARQLTTWSRQDKLRTEWFRLPRDEAVEGRLPT